MDHPDCVSLPPDGLATPPPPPPSGQAFDSQTSQGLSSSQVHTSFEDSQERSSPKNANPHGQKRPHAPTHTKRKTKHQKITHAVQEKHNAKTDPIAHYDFCDRSSPTRHLKKLHIYDFDNTLFRSPGPNPSLFQEGALGVLTSADCLANGGWWKEVLVFRNMGEGWEKEKAKAWDGYWNEDVVELMKMSIDDESVLTILLTGRRKDLFGGLIKEMLEAKGLYDGLDGLMLRQGEFASTIKYKTQALCDVLDHYRTIDEVTLYDDRKSQLNGFKKCLNEYAEALRPSLIANMVPVFADPIYLDPKVERTLVEGILEEHNKVISKNPNHEFRMHKCSLKKSHHYTGYTLSPYIRALVIEFFIARCPEIFDEEMLSAFKFQVEHIPIVRGQMSRVLQQQVKEKPEEVRWKMVSIGTTEDLVGILVEPENSDEAVKTMMDPPILPIASRGKSTARPPEEFRKITEWKSLGEIKLSIPTTVTKITNFRIVNDQGPQKSKKKGKPFDQQAELP